MEQYLTRGEETEPRLLGRGQGGGGAVTSYGILNENVRKCIRTVSFQSTFAPLSRDGNTAIHGISVRLF